MVHYCIFDPGVKINVPSQVHLKDTGRLNIGTFDDIYVIFFAIFLHFMMLVASRILMVGYYQYPHLSKLLPMISNDDQEKQDFCEIGILTIDYDCAFHIDKDSIANLDADFR